MLTHRAEKISNTDIAVKLDRVAKLGEQILSAIVDLRETLVRVSQENPTQQNR